MSCRTHMAQHKSVPLRMRGSIRLIWYIHIALNILGLFFKDVPWSEWNMVEGTVLRALASGRNELKFHFYILSSFWASEFLLHGGNPRRNLRFMEKREITVEGSYTQTGPHKLLPTCYCCLSPLPIWPRHSPWFFPCFTLSHPWDLLLGLDLFLWWACSLWTLPFSHRLSEKQPLMCMKFSSSFLP